MIVCIIDFVSSLFADCFMSQFKIFHAFTSVICQNLPFRDDDKLDDKLDDKINKSKSKFGSRIGRRIEHFFLYQSKKFITPKFYTWTHRICGILCSCIMLPWWILNNILWFIENPIDPKLFFLAIKPIYNVLEPLLCELKEDEIPICYKIEDDKTETITSTKQLAIRDITQIIDATKLAVVKNPKLLEKLDLPLLCTINIFLEFLLPMEVYSVSDREIEKMWGDAHKNYKDNIKVLTTIFIKLERYRDSLSLRPQREIL